MEKREERIKKVIKSRQEGVIVLEDIHDPHNAAAVMRTAEALGFYKIYFIFEKEAVYDPERIGKKSSASANKWLTIKSFRSTEECLKKLKKEGFEIIVSVINKEAEILGEKKIKKRKIALILGNEHRGVSNKAINLADRKLYIPMAGMVQSLNISVAAGIIMWEISSQRKKYGINKFQWHGDDLMKMINLFVQK